MKPLLLKIANAVSRLWQLMPTRLRLGFLTGLIVLESRGSNSGDGLSRLMLLKDRLEWIINERALAYGHGEHPKHRLTEYHQFFIDRISDGERVLDVGCGYGAVARSIARERPRSLVLGMDLDKPRLMQAQSSLNPPNLNFMIGDATREVPSGGWDVVVLSNVLEHIEARTDFLRAICETCKPVRILIRVPLFERDWQMPLRRELGVAYFSDEDHKIEHRLSEFNAELEDAGLRTTEVLTLWGEIWADCRPR